MSSLDVAALRDDTPGCRTVVHLNHAGASLAPTPVLDAVVGHLRREAEIGGYEAAAEAEADGRRAATYQHLARLVGGRSEEVAVVGSATRAWGDALHSLVHALGVGEGHRILIGHAEYVSSALLLLQLRDRTGVRVEVVDDDEAGQLSVPDLRRRLDGPGGEVKLICCTHVPTSSGLVNPIEEVGRVAAEAGVAYLVDACQSAGQLPLDVADIGCWALSATGRKFLRGPRGTGFLWVRADVAERLPPPLPDARSATWEAPDRWAPAPGAQRFETWEQPWAAVLGLGAAAAYALDLGVPAIAERVVALGAALRERLGEVDGVEVHDRGVRRCGIVTFSVAGWSAAEVVARSRARRINTSVSAAALAHLDLGHRGLPDLVRASVHVTTTHDELDALIVALEELTGHAR